MKLNLIGDGKDPAKVLAQAAAGKPPNVLQPNVGDPTSYVAKNLLMALDSYIETAA